MATKYPGDFLEGQSNKWESQTDNSISKDGRHYQMQTSEITWISFTNGSPQTSTTSSHMGTRGFEEEARSTATELERCRQERSQENGHQLGRGWRGCGGQEELEESCRPMRDKPGTRRHRIIFCRTKLSLSFREVDSLWRLVEDISNIFCNLKKEFTLTVCVMCWMLIVWDGYWQCQNCQVAMIKSTVALSILYGT